MATYMSSSEVTLYREYSDSRYSGFVSCPSCGRTEYDLIGTAKEVERRLRGKPWDITVAVMGCVVNGPGEASHADFGIAGGKSEGVIFKKGISVGRFPVATLADELCALIEREMA